MAAVSPPPAATCVRVRIEGLVQGVGFRYWTRKTAIDLGLDGWVRNRRDGGVEAVLAGSPSVVETMIARLRRGPRSSRVDRVHVEDELSQPNPGFDVLPTV